MIVRTIKVFVKPESVEAFEKVTIENHQGSIREPGVLRFDVLRNPERQGEYLLYEVYVDDGATAAHRETAHYKKWNETVGPMMAGDRQREAWSIVAPLERSAW
jgi:autoinducer 2-degrading protein